MTQSLGEECFGVDKPNVLRECEAGDVKNMNMGKEVATRLFKMLAVKDETVSAVKRDHASYAKLSLLTQQMNLLKDQAQTVVDKCEAKAIKFSKSEKLEQNSSDTRLMLSDEYDEGARRLVTMLDVSDQTVAAISSDDVASARMSLLAEQVGLLQAQAKQAVDDAALNKLLCEIGMSCRIVPGTVYYHYTSVFGKDVLSRIAPDEWCNYEEYHGKYLYDFDFIFRRLHGDVVDTDWCAATVPIPQKMYMPQLSMSTSTKLPTIDATPTTPSADSLHATPEATGLTATFEPVTKVHSRW